MAELARRRDEQTEPPQVGHLDQELADAAQQHAEREREDRRLDVVRQRQHGRDHADVEHGGAERGGEEAALGVQHAHGEGGEADQQQVRET